MPMVIISATEFIHMLMVTFLVSCPTSVLWDGDGLKIHGKWVGMGMYVAGTGWGQ
jgi:hypothetical protein